MKRKTRLSLTALAFLLTGLVILTIARWETWFGNPPEAPYLPANRPERILLTFGNDGPQSRMLSWICDTVVRSSHVELQDSILGTEQCVAAQGEIFVSRSGKGAYYRATLPQLEPGHVYRYRVCSGTTHSPWHRFVMPLRDMAQPDDFELLYFGDVQDTLGGNTHRLVMDAWRMHPEAEFVLLGGDLIERPTHTYWNEAFRGLDSLAQSLPILATTGNHEYLKYPIRKLERRFALTFPYFLASQVGQNHVYTLPYREAQFYLLDSNRELPYLNTQRNWLSQAFENSRARWNIVVLHHPIYSAKGKSNNFLQRMFFADLINDNADLVLQGHEHAYARMTQHDEQGRATTPLYLVSHCSPKHYRIQLDERFDRYGTGHQYYQSICVSGNTLSLRTYDAHTQELYDAVDIVKGEHDQATIVDRAQNIPERLDFQPHPGNKKDAAFAQRIADYKRKKGLK